MANEPMPPAGPGAQPPQGGGKQPSPEQIVGVVGEGLMAIGKMLDGNPKLQDRVAGVIQELDSIMQEASQGPAKQPAGAPAAMEQAGNPNARPV